MSGAVTASWLISVSYWKCENIKLLLFFRSECARKVLMNGLCWRDDKAEPKPGRASIMIEASIIDPIWTQWLNVFSVYGSDLLKSQSVMVLGLGPVVPVQYELDNNEIYHRLPLLYLVTLHRHNLRWCGLSAFSPKHLLSNPLSTPVSVLCVTQYCVVSYGFPLFIYTVFESLETGRDHPGVCGRQLFRVESQTKT